MRAEGYKVALHHRTQYNYGEAVTLGPQVVRLRPAPHCRTPILSYSLEIAPATHTLHWQQDVHGNYLARLVFAEKTKEFVVDVELTAELLPVNPFDFLLEPGAEEHPFKYSPELAKDLEPYRSKELAGPRLLAFLDSLQPMHRMGKVQEVVDAVLYLETASFVTGEILHVDGGAHAGRW